MIACGKEDPKFFYEKKPIPELPYQGFRQDIPNERRGNAAFAKAVFTADGRYLLTLGPGIKVWDAATGALLRTLPANLDGNDPLATDGTHHLVLAHRGDVAPHMPEATGYWIWDFQDGSRRGPIPEGSWPAHRTQPVGFTPRGEAVVLQSGGVSIDVWKLDGSGPRLRLAAPPGRRFCMIFDPLAHDKQCAELSRSGRWLALTDHDPANNIAPIGTWLADLERGTLHRITLPDSVAVRSGNRGFAFSPDEQTLALVTTDGMWIGYRVGAGDSIAAGRFVRGEHQRNHFLLPIGYTADGKRIVAMGDQLTVATYDALTGALVGRVQPPFEDHEGAVRVSADGSRAIVYRYIADILVVIDGATGTRRGYVCPYFCNRALNPVAVPYAVSPDGRRVATGGRLGAGLWDVDADTLIAPLVDPARARLKPR
ncbi:MAG: hypothetical protein ACREBE_12695 [bacterium]